VSGICELKPRNLKFIFILLKKLGFTSPGGKVTNEKKTLYVCRNPDHYGYGFNRVAVTIRWGLFNHFWLTALAVKFESAGRLIWLTESLDCF